MPADLSHERSEHHAKLPCQALKAMTGEHTDGRYVKHRADDAGDLRCVVRGGGGVRSPATPENGLWFRVTITWLLV